MFFLFILGLVLAVGALISLLAVKGPERAIPVTAIAGQRKKTNAAESEANAALAKNNTLTVLVLESRCLDQLEAMVKAHLTVPAGFNCGLGGQVAGIIAK